MIFKCIQTSCRDDWINLLDFRIVVGLYVLNFASQVEDVNIMITYLFFLIPSFFVSSSSLLVGNKQVIIMHDNNINDFFNKKNNIVIFSNYHNAKLTLQNFTK